MAQISLLGMKFHAFHGVYPEEKLIGGHFVLDVVIDTDIEDAGDEDDISQTMNYEVIHQICKGVMNNPMDLLETVILNLKEELQNHFTEMDGLSISLSKVNPPLSGQVASATIEESCDFVKDCGRCGKPMTCYNNEYCWCNNLNIPSLTLSRINEQFGTKCLCPSCMSDYVKIEE